MRGAMAVAHCEESQDHDNLLDNPQWVDKAMQDLIESAVHAQERGGQPRMAIAQRLRRGFPELSDEAKKRLRQRAYRAWDGVRKGQGRSPLVQGEAFDRFREQKKRQSEAARRGHRTMKERGTVPTGRSNSAPAQEYQDRIPAGRLMVVVQGPWGELGMGLDVDREGRVHVEGRISEVEARAYLEAARGRPGSVLVTNRGSL